MERLLTLYSEVQSTDGTVAVVSLYCNRENYTAAG